MENQIQEKKTQENNENNKVKENKLIENKSEKNIIKNILKNVSNTLKETNQESEETNRLDKSQILQNKLKKIFLERETNKFKYNIINIPDNLKYSSDNSNSSSPRRDFDESNSKKNKDVKNQNVIKENNIPNNEKINVNKNEESINSDNENHIDKEKTKSIEEEKKKEEANNSNAKNHNIDDKVIGNVNKNIDYQINNINDNIQVTENNNINLEDNNDVENYMNKNKNLNNNRKQTKNYVIKRIPERKKNRNINNEEDFRNRTFSTGFINHKKNYYSDLKSKEHNISGKITEKEEKKISNINHNNNEKDEERNKRLYRLLMAKKLSSSQNLIMNNINQVINSNKPENYKGMQNESNLDNSDKNKVSETPKKEENYNFEQKKEPNTNINKEDNKDNETLYKNNKDRSKSIKMNESKEINEKEIAMKILELIKVKKCEKNFIDQKKKETQEIIKKAKSQPIDFTESNSTLVAKEEEINENKNNFNIITNKQIQVKEKENTYESEKSKKNENERCEENEKKEISKKIYKKYKGKSPLIGNNNIKLKNEFDNNAIKSNSNKNVEYNINKENENINNKEFIKNEFKKDIKENNEIKKIKNINIFENSGYKTEIEESNALNIEINKKDINNIKDKENNIILNSKEKRRREKLEKDLAAEINKEELTDRNNKGKSKNISKKKFIGINRHHTSINISNNKQYYIHNNKKRKIQINQPNNKNAVIKYNISQPKIENSNNINELNLLQNQNDVIANTSTNMNNNNKSLSHNFYPNTKDKKYEQMKTYQNPLKSIDNYNKKNNANNLSLKNQNKINSINNIYAPKKCHLLNKIKTKTRDLTNSPFSPGVYTNNVSNKKNNKSPKVFNVNNEKMTYIKKNLSNLSSNKKDSNHRLNYSLGNIPSSFNNNFDINKIIKNKMSTEIDSLELKHNLNSSFHMRMNLGKKKYNTGNIFNQEDDDNDYPNNNININYNLNPSYNNKFFQKNLKKNPINLENAYNTFYINNKINIGNNYLNKNLFVTNKNNCFNNDSNYGIISNFYNKKNENKNNWKKNYENISIYNSINSFNQKIVNKNFQMELIDIIKYEDLLVLEDKLMNVMMSLNNEKLIFNECFDYWNYFFNSSLCENINRILSTFDLEKKNLIKISLNYNLMSIILSYDTSFESGKLDKIRPLLLEMLELCHKLLITTYEFILDTTKNDSNIWVKKLYHLIISSKLSDGSDTLFLESSKISETEKMKYNTNYLIQKIHYILFNYPSSFSQSYLMSIFKKINNKSYDDINDFFLEYILREKDVKYSILASSFLKSGEIITPRPYPYLNYTSPKNYTLVLDVDETLFHFKINEDDDEQGVLKIRPGVFQFIDEIKEYYEIILFSEADKNYTELILDAVGENRYLYDYILCRDYVTIVGQNFVKELSKIGRPLDRIIIIDNMPQNFSFNKENGIYIKSFWGEENDDKALIDLIPILVNIARSGKDVRKELVKYKEKIVTKISSNIYKHNYI